MPSLRSMITLNSLAFLGIITYIGTVYYPTSSAYSLNDSESNLKFASISIESLWSF